MESFTSGQLMSLGKSNQVGSAGDLSSSQGQAQGGQLSEAVRPAPIQACGGRGAVASVFFSHTSLASYCILPSFSKSHMSH